MNEKMYDFEEKKRNNLVFYGIPETEGGETDDILDRKISQVITRNMMRSKERRKIRFIEGKAQCRHLTKLTCKGTLRQVFICLSPEQFTKLVRKYQTWLTLFPVYKL
jgi:hypothetical protein